MESKSFEKSQIKTKIILIEDSIIHREWLKEKLLEDESFLIIATESKGSIGVTVAKVNNPDIVLLDFQLSDITGLEVARRIKVYDSNIKILALTAHTDLSILARILNDKNIDGLAIKGSYYFENDILKAVHSILDGESYIDPSLLNKIRNLRQDNHVNDLSRREFEVFIQLSLGKTDNEIAEDLFVDLNYIKNLKSKIRKKINRVTAKNITSILNGSDAQGIYSE